MSQDENTYRTSVSLPTHLWNKIAPILSDDDITFSRWVQDCSRLGLRIRKARNIKELVSSLDPSEIELLKKELGI